MTIKDGLEYRVVWQRRDVPRATKLYQTKAAAERFVLVLQGRIAEVVAAEPELGFDPDCDYYTERFKDIPPIVSGPNIEQRSVGEWTDLTEGREDGH